MTVKLKIGRMKCDGCVASVRAAIESLPGAEASSVEVGSAVVEYDGDPQELVTAVNAAGYPCALSE